MKITNLHSARDDVPIGIRGVRLERSGELTNFYDNNLTKVIKENEDLDPIKTKISLGLKGLDPGILKPFYWMSAKTFDFRLKRKMKDLGADFAYIQFGALYDCYDFFRLNSN